MTNPSAPAAKRKPGREYDIKAIEAEIKKLTAMIPDICIALVLGLFFAYAVSGTPLFIFIHELGHYLTAFGCAKINGNVTYTSLNWFMVDIGSLLSQEALAFLLAWFLRYLSFEISFFGLGIHIYYFTEIAFMDGGEFCYDIKNLGSAVWINVDILIGVLLFISIAKRYRLPPKVFFFKRIFSQILTRVKY